MSVMKFAEFSARHEHILTLRFNDFIYNTILFFNQQTLYCIKKFFSSQIKTTINIFN